MTAAAVPDTPASEAVRLRDVRVVLGERSVLRGVTLSIPTGTRAGVVGPNGAGKSTLLRVIAGLTRPETGEVRVRGRGIVEDPVGFRAGLGMVAHQPMLHPDLTARENLRFYARLYGLDGVEERVEEGLRRVGLVAHANSRAATLSRGMTQRLALMRALIHEPSLLLLDEAETGLDAQATALLTDIIRESEVVRTVIMTSHDLQYVHEHCDTVVFLVRGQVVDTVHTRDLAVEVLRQRYAALLDTPAPTTQPRRRAS